MYNFTVKRSTIKWKGEVYISIYNLIRSTVEKEDRHLPRN